MRKKLAAFASFLLTFILSFISPPLVAGEVDTTTPTFIIVTGAGGEPEYTEQFTQWSARWHDAAERLGAEPIAIGQEPTAEGQTDRERLKKALSEQIQKTESPLVIVLLGHGTFYRDIAKFNLRGPDVSAKEFSQWLEPIVRPVVVVNCSSSSGPFINRLSAPDRIVVTSTNSGAEQNYSRFGDYLSTAISESRSDLDHDDQVSLLEAFLWASAQVNGFYEQEARLVTEHALIDDNADALGTPADFFQGIRATKSARDGAQPDGLRAHQLVVLRSPDAPNLTPAQLVQRDQLERQIEKLRQTKDDMDEDQYYRNLESLLIPLARLYQTSAESSEE